MDYLEKLEMLEKRIERLEELVEKNACRGTKAKELSNERKTPVCERFDFTEKEVFEKCNWKMENATFVSDDMGLTFESVSLVTPLGFSSDPMLINDSIRVSLDGIGFIRVRLKSDVSDGDECSMNCYFTTERHSTWSQSKAVTCYYKAGIMTDVYTPVKNRFWKGTLTGLRIDPVEKMRGSVEIELVQLIADDMSVVYEYDFTKVQNLKESPWVLRNATATSCKNNLSFDIYAVEKKKVRTNPFIYNESLGLCAEDVKYLHIKLRTDINGEKCDFKDGKKIYLQVLFTTENSNFWSRDKSIRYFYECGKTVDAYIETKQLFWKGTLTGLRIEPFESYDGRTRIELLELLSDIPSNSAFVRLCERVERIENVLENI